MGTETFFRFGLTPFNLLQTLMVKTINQSINNFVDHICIKNLTYKELIQG